MHIYFIAEFNFVLLQLSIHLQENSAREVGYVGVAYVIVFLLDTWLCFGLRHSVNELC